MSQFSTPLLYGPMDGEVWSQATANRQDDQLEFQRDSDDLTAIYLFQWDYEGRGPRFVYWRSQFPIKSKSK